MSRDRVKPADSPPVLSLMSSLFDSFFGFIFWGVAYFRMRKVDGGSKLPTSERCAEPGDNG